MMTQFKKSKLAAAVLAATVAAPASAVSWSAGDWEVSYTGTINLFANMINNNVQGGEDSFHMKTLQRDAGIIEKVILELFDYPVKLKFEINEKNASKTETKKQKSEGDTEHPLFMQVLETFEGELLR